MDIRSGENIVRRLGTVTKWPTRARAEAITDDVNESGRSLNERAEDIESCARELDFCGVSVTATLNCDFRLTPFLAGTF